MRGIFKLKMVLAIGCLLIGPFASLPALAAPLFASQVASQERARINFNADWRFNLEDVPGAQNPEFNDAAWDHVGLPHSFSIPYFRAPAFYVGYGWYRKSFLLPRLPLGRRLSLEFEGAFQVAEVFVNGMPVGRHRGGYTGFSLDITEAVRPGRNLVAVRVNNRWDPTLAPRAGEHVFSGGLYRDVWLLATSAVHVPWTGTFITTPELSDTPGRVAAQTEVRNDSGRPARVTVRTQILDDRKKIVTTLPDQVAVVPAGRTIVVQQSSAALAGLRLWTPETAVLYHAATSLIVSGRIVDRFNTEFGFRWISWTPEQGFFLNGKHRYFKGANVHQDQAGWGDAVTNGAMDRDVQLMKDAGFDFIRGSHYPHDPHFAEATDRIGMLFLSEESFWGTGGFNNKDWTSSAYPTDPAQDAAFDASVKQELTEMIRINRNHPSIVAWGMDNEVFFTAKQTLPDVRSLLAEEVALAHQLDPTRPASIDGAQRGGIDRIGDIAGYNGDGAVLFPDPGIPNFVSEYGSTMADQPGPYVPGWGDLPRTPTNGSPASGPYPWRLPWRSGEVLWAGFDHGSIAGRKFGGMGIVDYFRLPKRSWYWYRNAYRGIGPPAWPRPGQPAALQLTSSSPTIEHADGTDDVQLLVIVVDAKGIALSNTPPVKLTIESGPGELPTGRSISFSRDSDIVILDGKAAIAMRSYQAGVSRLRATSPGLNDGVLTITTLDGPPFVPGVTPVVAARPYQPVEEAPPPSEREQKFGTNNPTSASSTAPGHLARFVNDGDPATYWAPSASDTSPWVSVDPERILLYHRLILTFPEAAGYGFVAELQQSDGSWEELAREDMGTDTSKLREVATRALTGEKMRIKLIAPGGAAAGIAEIVIVGVLQNK